MLALFTSIGIISVNGIVNLVISKVFPATNFDLVLVRLRDGARQEFGTGLPGKSGLQRREGACEGWFAFSPMSVFKCLLKCGGRRGPEKVLCYDDHWLVELCVFTVVEGSFFLYLTNHCGSGES